jgi:uncharacterized protein YeaO (DUF488 family)
VLFEEDSSQRDLPAARGFGRHPDFGGPALARGLAREGARIDAWIKDAAPSDALRRWYAHDPAKWPEFRARYIAELKHNPAVVELQDMAAKSKTLTLLFAAKDSLRNNAAVLQEFLRGDAASQ